MKPGRELDALVAEKVMGWEWATLMSYPGIAESTWLVPPGYVAGLVTPEPPNYSTDIAAAWEVVEKLAAYRPSTFNIEKCGAWLVRFSDGPRTPAKTAPHASFGRGRVYVGE